MCKKIFFLTEYRFPHSDLLICAVVHHSLLWIVRTNYREASLREASRPGQWRISTDVKPFACSKEELGASWSEHWLLMLSLVVLLNWWHISQFGSTTVHPDICLQCGSVAGCSEQLEWCLQKPGLDLCFGPNLWPFIFECSTAGVKLHPVQVCVHGLLQ